MKQHITKNLIYRIMQTFDITVAELCDAFDERYQLEPSDTESSEGVESEEFEEHDSTIAPPNPVFSELTMSEHCDQNKCDNPDAHSRTFFDAQNLSACPGDGPQRGRYMHTNTSKSAPTSSDATEVLKVIQSYRSAPGTASAIVETSTDSALKNRLDAEERSRAPTGASWYEEVCQSDELSHVTTTNIDNARPEKLMDEESISTAHLSITDHANPFPTCYAELDDVPCDIGKNMA